MATMTTTRPGKFRMPHLNVQKALAESEEISAWIRENWPTSFVEPGVERFAVASYSIAMDHRAAVLLLLTHNARTSAFALARPILEAYLRGAWTQHCATVEDIERASAINALPGVDAMVRALDKLQPTQGTFGEAKRIAWAATSDYAHGGIRQLSRWLSAEEIAPRHSDLEVCELLSMVDIFGMMSCVGVATIAGAATEIYLLKAQAVISYYRDARHQR